MTPPYLIDDALGRYRHQRADERQALEQIDARVEQLAALRSRMKASASLESRDLRRLLREVREAQEANDDGFWDQIGTLFGDDSGQGDASRRGPQSSVHAGLDLLEQLRSDVVERAVFALVRIATDDEEG